MGRRRRATVAVCIVATAVVAVLGASWEPLWDFAMYRVEEEYYPSGQVRRRETSDRWDNANPYVRQQEWHENGIMRMDSRDSVSRSWDKTGRLIRAYCMDSLCGVDAVVLYHPDGSFEVLQQVLIDGKRVDRSHAPSSVLTEEQIERALSGQWP